ncbi:unnamed protein product, partial [Musa banksii]
FLLCTQGVRRIACKAFLFARLRDLSVARSFDLTLFLFYRSFGTCERLQSGLILAEQDRKSDSRLRQRKLSSRLWPQGCRTP